MSFNLDKFEYNCYNKKHEDAAKDLASLIATLDQHLGEFGNNFSGSFSKNLTADQLKRAITTRICSAISCLFADSNFFISESGLNHFFSYHRWLSALFAASDFVNMDHVVKSFNTSNDYFTHTPGQFNLNVEVKNLSKLCVLYSPESEIPIDLDNFWKLDSQLITRLALVLLSPRFLGSPQSHEKREILLPWLTKKLTELDSIENLPFGILHDVYMHCSYADRKDKHDIKKSINFVVRKLLDQNQVKDIDVDHLNKVLTDKKNDSKPVLLVVLEWFNKGHSIYRTHSLTIEAAKANFHVIGMGLPNAVDETGRGIFDEFIVLEDQNNIFDHLKLIKNVCETRNVSILYMPSVGMFQLTIFLTNLRFAPIQIIALGHPATTHSEKIDYVVVEEDYVGDKKCFSEKLMILPKDGMPYRPSAFFESTEVTKKVLNSGFNKSQVDVCVAATTMKLNPNFLRTCEAIKNQSKEKVHFHFLVGQAIGLTTLNVERVLKKYLGDAVTLYPHQPYPEYMKVIDRMDLFLNPFPFGNTNGIIDTVSAGLVGICKTGPEVHEHIDEGLFKRLGFPHWMIADSIEMYIKSALRLINNHNERIKLQSSLTGYDKVQKIFKGRPAIMGQLFKKELDLQSKFHENSF